MTEGTEAERLEKCGYYGTKCEEDNQDCMACKEEEPDMFECCKTQTAGGIDDVANGPTDETEEPSTTNEADRITTHECTKTKTTSLGHRLSSRWGFIDKRAIEGLNDIAICNEWNEANPDTPITILDVRRHLKHIPKKHGIRIEKNKVTDADAFTYEFYRS